MELADRETKNTNMPTACRQCGRQTLVAHVITAAAAAAPTGRTSDACDVTIRWSVVTGARREEFVECGGG